MYVASGTVVLGLLTATKTYVHLVAVEIEPL